MVPFLFFSVAFVIAGIWLALVIQSHRLLDAFRERYPNEALAKIPGAFEWSRNPGKFSYFLSDVSRTYLAEQGDAPLLKLRTTVRRLTLAAVLTPVVLILCAAVAIFVAGLQR